MGCNLPLMKRCLSILQDLNAVNETYLRIYFETFPFQVIKLSALSKVHLETNVTNLFRVRYIHSILTLDAGSRDSSTCDPAKAFFRAKDFLVRSEKRFNIASCMKDSVQDAIQSKRKGFNLLKAQLIFLVFACLKSMPFEISCRL